MTAADANWRQLCESGKARHVPKKQVREHTTEQALKKEANGPELKQVQQVLMDTGRRGLLASLFPPFTASKAREPGKYIAIDCEMVGVGPQGLRSVLARVSIVNFYGHVLIDKFVKPCEKVTDYREAITGIRPLDLQKGELFSMIMEQVNALIKGRVLIGHGLSNDLKVLMTNPPKRLIRDTSKWKRLRQVIKSHGTPSLKQLTQDILGVQIQASSHDSVEDAMAAMLIYRKYKTEWEAYIRNRGVCPGSS